MNRKGFARKWLQPYLGTILTLSGGAEENMGDFRRKKHSAPDLNRAPPEYTFIALLLHQPAHYFCTMSVVILVYCVSLFLLNLKHRHTKLVTFLRQQNELFSSNFSLC
jgi:hypothetical protein